MNETDLLAIERSMGRAMRKAILHAGWAGFGFHRSILKADAPRSTIAALQRKGLVRNGGILTSLGMNMRDLLSKGPDHAQ